MKVCNHPKELCKYCGRMVPMGPPEIIEIQTRAKKKKQTNADRRLYLRNYYYTVQKKKRQIDSKLKAQQKERNK